MSNKKNKKTNKHLQRKLIPVLKKSIQESWNFAEHCLCHKQRQLYQNDFYINRLQHERTRVVKSWHFQTQLCQILPLKICMNSKQLWWIKIICRDVSGDLAMVIFFFFNDYQSQRKCKQKILRKGGTIRRYHTVGGTVANFK